MQKILQNKILQSSGLILFFTAITYILNYAYTLVAIHFLSPFEYSELALLIAIYSLFGIFGATISNISLPLLHDVENTKIKNQVVIVTKFLSIILGILSFTIIPFLISKIFNINNYTNIILFSLGGVATLSLALLTAHLQVVKKFAKVGLIQVVSTFIKFFGSLIFLFFGYKILGVGIALLLSSILAFLLFFPWTEENQNMLTSPLLNKGGAGGGLIKNFWQEHKKFLIKSFFGSLILTLLITLDTILAKRFLSEELVGFFVGISTLAKLFLYGNIAISSVIFPFYLSEKDENKKKNILNYFIYFILFTGFLFIIISYFMHNFLVPLILGQKYLLASNYLFPISTFVISGTLAYVFTQLSILTNNKNFLKNISIYFVIFIISTFIFINYFTITIYSFSYFLTLSYLILFLITYTNSKN
jgi:O-antigen/teichoic acid export membrane protein